MEPMTWAFIGTLFGAIIGVTSSILAAYLNTRNNAKIQLNAIASQRNDRLREAQGKYLMELQETLADLMRGLTERILDDSLRKSINEAHQTMNQISLANARAESQQALDKARSSYKTLAIEMGFAIRGCFDSVA